MKSRISILCTIIFLSTGVQSKFFEYTQEAHQEVMNEDSSDLSSAIKVCWGWSCKNSNEVLIRESMKNNIKEFFVPVAHTAREERKQIRVAIGKIEEMVGELTGVTDRDLGFPNSQGIGLEGQMDCVDESTNTTRYLRYLDALGVLHFHNVSTIEMRFNKPWMPLVGQHFTATIVESNNSRAKYAVDSWWFDNGVPPIIQQLNRWKKRKDFDPEYVP